MEGSGGGWVEGGGWWRWDGVGGWREVVCGVVRVGSGTGGCGRSGRERVPTDRSALLVPDCGL